jgi:hypothetical protein
MVSDAARRHPKAPGPIIVTFIKEMPGLCSVSLKMVEKKHGLQ